MQKKLITLALIAALCSLFCSCGKEKEQEPDSSKEQTTTPVDKPHWEAVRCTDYSGSMTLIATVPSGETLSADDELAAFADGVCRAVAYQENGLLYLGIPGPENETAIEVRYYSASLKSIRVLRLTYVPGSMLGSSDAPYTLVFSATLVPLRLSGTIRNSAAAAPRRVNIGSEAGDQLQLYWREGDKLLVQQSNGTNTGEVTLTKGADTDKGDFEGWGTVDYNHYVTYPTTTTYANEGLTFTLPAEQTYVANNYANNLMPMYGQVSNAEGDFTISAVGCVLCVQLIGSKKVKSVTITSPESGDNLSGTFTSGGTTTTGGTGKSVILNCGEGVQLSSTPTKFLFVLPAVTLAQNTQFIVTFMDDATFTKTSSTALILGQGEYIPLTAFEAN